MGNNYSLDSLISFHFFCIFKCSLFVTMHKHLNVLVTSVLIKFLISTFHFSYTDLYFLSSSNCQKKKFVFDIVDICYLYLPSIGGVFVWELLFTYSMSEVSVPGPLNSWPQQWALDSDPQNHSGPSVWKQWFI